jgi:integrase/recombinase XerD
MSRLREQAEAYLAMRRALGFKLETQGPLLHRFIDYLEHAGAETITIDLALAWAKTPADATAVWWAKKLSIVRGFARHLHTLDSSTQIPPADVLPYRYRRANPYVYSVADVAALMAAAYRLRRPLQAATYATLVGLLAVSGLRIGEAIGLEQAHVDSRAGWLQVVSGKYGKSREVPLHPSTCAALDRYAVLRNELAPRPRSTAFFVSTAGTRLLPANVHRTFARLVRDAELPHDPERRAPRVHDLRHSFAITTVRDWYRDGVDVQPRLPLLSTVLGHVGPASTYWYLTAIPELLAEAAKQLETRRWS